MRLGLVFVALSLVLTLTFIAAVPLSKLQRQMTNQQSPSASSSSSLSQSQSLSSTQSSSSSASSSASSSSSSSSSSSQSSKSLLQSLAAVVVAEDFEGWNLADCLKTADSSHVSCRDKIKASNSDGVKEEQCDTEYNDKISKCERKWSDCVKYAESKKIANGDENALTALTERCADGFTKQRHYRNDDDKKHEAEVEAGKRQPSTFASCYRTCDANRFECRSPLKPGDADFADQTFETTEQVQGDYMTKNAELARGETPCQANFYRCVDACLAAQEACMNQLEALDPADLQGRSTVLKSC